MKTPTTCAIATDQGVGWYRLDPVGAGDVGVGAVVVEDVRPHDPVVDEHMTDDGHGRFEIFDVLVVSIEVDADDLDAPPLVLLGQGVQNRGTRPGKAGTTRPRR